ncbi:MAG: hypothetical protein J6J60_09360 [Clostridia bacterium]|nr:hypothetical protein [Clostridia bacterium]
MDYKFGNVEFESLKINKSDLILLRKQMSNFQKQARDNAKLNKCYYCGKDTTQICNSHSIPQFALKHIALDGEILYTNAVVKIPTEKEKKGLNEAGTFRIICRECDSKIFQNYENPENYLTLPTPKILAEISLKNYLHIISKRLIETELFNQAHTITNNPLHLDYAFQKLKTIQLDLFEYKKAYEKAKRISIKNWENEYYIIFFKKLDYVVPIAYQNNIALVCDIKGNIINDIYSTDDKYKIQDIQLCIFPLKDSSIILLFMDSNNKRYRTFNKQFQKLNDEEKLELLNYIIFKYSEDVFLNKKLEKIMTSSEELKNVIRSTSDMTCSTYNLLETPNNYDEALKKEFNLENKKNIPNFLSRKFAL